MRKYHSWNRQSRQDFAPKGCHFRKGSRCPAEGPVRDLGPPQRRSQPRVGRSSTSGARFICRGWRDGKCLPQNASRALRGASVAISQTVASPPSQSPSLRCGLDRWISSLQAGTDKILLVRICSHLTSQLAGRPMVGWPHRLPRHMMPRVAAAATSR